MMLKVLVIDDQPRLPVDTSAAIAPLAAELEVMAAHDADTGLATAAGHPDLDLVLLDLELPDTAGLNLIASLHEQHPSLPVVVLSPDEQRERARQAINAGAAGFIPKSAATRVLIRALQQVGEGAADNPPDGVHDNPPRTRSDPMILTLRQCDVLAGICEGKTNRQIALELGLSEKTIKAHVTAIFKALGVVNRTQAVLAAQRAGGFSVPRAASRPEPAV